MAEWFVNAAGGQTGPHPAEHVVHWVRTGQVPPSASFWRDGGDGWLSLVAAWPLLTGIPNGSPDLPTAPMPPSSAVPSQQPQQPHKPQPQQPNKPPQQPKPNTQQPSATAPPPPDAPTVPDQSTLPDHPPGRGGVYAFTDRLADFAGVERLEGFRIRDLLSATFRRYSREEVEQHFATGLPGFTPPLAEIESGWPKPWMFVRLFAGTALLFAGFLLLTQLFGNANLLPGLILLGSFAVPLSIMVFFFEVNTPRNVSLYLVIHCMLVGSLISLAVTLLLTAVTSLLGPFIDPLLTGVVEEAAKLLAVFLITLRLQPQRYPWILNGVLFGAAIGAGFACFESAGYAFRYLVAQDGFDLGAAIQVIVVRGFLAPFGHVVWTALTAGALWRVKLDQRLVPRMLVHRRVLRMAVVVMALHAIWDFGYLDPPFLIKYLVLGAVAWLLAFGMLEAGLKQIKAAQVSAREGRLQVSGSTVVLRTMGS
ncbi:MAG TPA: PrsW family glutamic-type intramembrane protease [Kineosporiaceae bacterium]|nr:PrsW family glutamic-type intramembrane protease [Kineosporiaceae bacterium]